MSRQEYKATEKKINKMTRDGLTEENLATGSRKNISKKIEDVDFRKSSDSLSFVRKAGEGKTKKPRQRQGGEFPVIETLEKKENLSPEGQTADDKKEEAENSHLYFQREDAVFHENRKKNYQRKKRYRVHSNKKSDLQFEQGNVPVPEQAETKIYSSKLEHLEHKAQKAADKLEQGRKKQSHTHSLKAQRAFKEDKNQVKYKLYFEDVPKTPKQDGMVRSTLKKSGNQVQNLLHSKVSQVERENSGVEAAHKTEQAGESMLRYRSNRRIEKYRRQKSRINRLEKRVYHTQTKYQYRKFIEENPQMQKKSMLNKFYQKQRIKREYQKAYRSGKGGTKVAKRSASAEATTKIAKKLQEILTKNRAVLCAGLCMGILLIFIMAGFSSCSMMFSNTVSTTFFSCFLSEPAEIDKADMSFSQKEIELQKQIDRVETDYPGYDEYRYNLGAIGHNPFELIAYLSAKYTEFTYEQVETELGRLFQEMYAFTTEEVVEIRTRTETQTVTVINPITGEETEEEIEVQVEYEYYILDVKLTVKPLSILIAGELDAEQTELFALYMDNKGGLQQLGTPLNLYWYNYVSSYYGYRKNPISGQEQLHRGLDIAVPTGTDVLAGHTGVVTTAAYHNEYGNYIVIKDEKGFESKYAHLNSLGVTVGQQVTIGKKIGKTGNTGSSSGSHLHIEVLFEGEYYNPLLYFNVGEGTLYGETPGEGDVIPPDSYDDETVERLIREAERYLGMPYTFGGTPPASFDCSAFVCWVFTNSGVHDLPRTTAQGIYDQCSPLSADEAKAGDIIFFTGTYNAGRPVTHVGIYCGNGIMIHCGDPIQYASINTSYWQSHFYGFGRLN